MDAIGTIFLIGDDPVALRALTAVVAASFPRVESFPSVEAFLSSYGDRPGCLIIDTSAPSTHGIPIYRQLVQKSVSLPVVFVSGPVEVPTVVEAMQAGAVNFLQRPVRDQDLCDSIHKALEKDAEERRRFARCRRTEERLSRLTAGEREVLDLILEGKMNKEIATELGLSTRTVEDRRAKLMKKMGARSVAELVRLVMTH